MTIKDKAKIARTAVSIYTGGKSEWIVPVVVIGAVGIGGWWLWSKFGKKTTTVWQPVLSVLVNSSALANTPSLSSGWAPVLTAVVNSPMIIATAISTGWQPVLPALVNSPTLAMTIISFGWQPCLTSLKNSPVLTVPGYNIIVTVSPAGAGTVSPGSGIFPAGNAAFTPTPAIGYKFDHWEINGVNQGNWVILNVLINGNATITAVFTPVTSNYTLTTSVSPSAAGFIEQTPAGNSFPAGTFISLRAYAWNDNTYQFDTWIDPSGLIPSIQLMFNPIQVSMIRNIQLIAHFIPVTTPPPPGGPSFPAPGTPGDGETWYWVVLTTDSGNWYISYDYLDIQGSSNIVSVAGPYASGATG